MAATQGPAPIGRESELALIAEWIGASRAAQEQPVGPRVLAIAGDPGIGKTTVWQEAIRRAEAEGWSVLTCRPRPSDVGLAHLGLSDLLRPVTDEVVHRLPVPQARAILIATLRAEAASKPLDPHAVGVGLAALLTELAEDRPLLLAVDDLQWMDRASAWALAFAINRVAAHNVLLLATVRTETARQPSSALRVMELSLESPSWRRIRLGPLSVGSLHNVLVHELGLPVARPLLVRIHHAAAGNPFLALEIARELQRVGSPPPGRPLPVPEDEREMALLRIHRLPRATRDVLAQVAAMSRPSVHILDVDALVPAERARIIAVQPDGSVDFCHPLFGSALYGSLPEAERRRLHQDLASRTANPEERARHLALAADGPDESIAAEVDRAADAAGARGAGETVVELKQLALQLTPPDDEQAVLRRELELADRRYHAGDPNGARAQLERCLARLDHGENRAQVLLELGSVLDAMGEADRGLELLAEALAHAETPLLKARIHARASSMAVDFDVGAEHAEAALALIDDGDDPLLYSFALHNAARCKLFAGRGADHAAVDQGMRLQREGAAWEVSVLPAYWALYFDDFDTARSRFEELVRIFRDRGGEARCSALLAHLAVLEALTGHMKRAKSLARESLDLAVQTDQETWVVVALWATGQVAARAGDLSAARTAAQEMLAHVEAQPDVTLENMAKAVLGLAALSGGDFAEADRQLSRSAAIVDSYHAREPAADRFHADHAEAVICLGDLQRAEHLVERLEQRAASLPRPWVTAVAARSRGLLNAARGDLDAAANDYQRALEAHATLAMPSELGRTLLAAGKLYRRRNERQRARSALASALKAFEAGGAISWAEQAREELRRAGGARGNPMELTATELAVAELAANGLRNREIAGQMFLSEKTVEANLSRVFMKLDIRSRAELGRRLPGNSGAASTKT